MTMENTNREKGEEEIARGIVGKWGYEEKYWWGPIAQTLKDAREEGRKEVLDEIKHEQKKLRDGFSHPADCVQCRIPNNQPK